MKILYERIILEFDCFIIFSFYIYNKLEAVNMWAVKP